MPTAAAGPLQQWHDFYAVIATASATLIGAMFVVVSVGAGFLTQERSPATRVFLTPTVTHLSIVLFAGALILVPLLDWISLGVAIGIAGLVGLVYAVLIALRVGRYGIDVPDRLWYAGLPLVGYAVMLAAAAAGFSGWPMSLKILAAALGLLLASAIRNAWDMILHIVAQTRTPS